LNIEEYERYEPYIISKKRQLPSRAGGERKKKKATKEKRE
jgi:hypothetical protein